MSLLQALFDLEATNQELKSDLRDLYITSAQEIDVGSSSRKAIIIHVSPALLIYSDSSPMCWQALQSTANKPFACIDGDTAMNSQCRSLHRIGSPWRHCFNGTVGGLQP